MEEDQLARVRSVKAAHEKQLMRKANVVGVGVGLRHCGGRLTDEPVVVVSVTHKVPRAALNPEDIIPSELEGVPVDVQEIGHVRAH
ncbi:MAG: hypothetical protein PVI59_03785 [Anaerolineae bacterium]|jgi:hypothetical protein